MQSLIGTRLGPYEIVAPLGAGGMGEVYRARDTRLGRDVAVKVLPTAIASDPDALARFDREARAVAAINHPNILALHDIGTHDGVAHAVTELLEGETLRQRLHSGPPPARKALDWAVQLAHGLAAAHDRGIVHRDLKPENVFLTRDGRIKILDFGIARRELPDPDVAGNLTTISERGVFVGTPAYASPEQVVGESATPRSDLFSFGIVLYELLTGTNPFLRETVADTMTAILRADPPPLLGRVAGVPAAALRIAERCLEKEPSGRPSSARDVALFLEASAGVGSDASFTLTADDGRASARRLQLKVLAISCGLLLAVIGSMWAYVQTRAGGAVDAVLERGLQRDQALVRRVEDTRLDRLELTARLLASFPSLKDLFEKTDAATIRDVLVSYQQQNPGTPLLVAIGRTGTVLGRTDIRDPGGPNDADAWLSAVGGQYGAPALVFVGGLPYHAAGAPAVAGLDVFGYIVAAAPVDRDFARTIGEATGDEAVVMSRSAILGSTFADSSVPWASLDEWRAQGGSTDAVTRVSIGARRFAAREVSLKAETPVSVVIARSRDDALEPYRRIQSGLVLIGLAGVVAALAASLWLYRQG
jgi:hypothetical protein